MSGRRSGTDRDVRVEEQQPNDGQQKKRGEDDQQDPSRPVASIRTLVVRWFHEASLAEASPATKPRRDGSDPRGSIGGTPVLGPGRNDGLNSSAPLPIGPELLARPQRGAQRVGMDADSKADGGCKVAAIRPGRPVAKRRPSQADAPVVPPPPPAPPAQGRGLTLPAVVVGLAVLLGAFLLRGGGSGDAEGGAESSETPTAEVTFEGEVLNLDPITLNLADGKIVRVAIALQLVADLPGAEKALEAPASYGARALDETITVLGGLTRTELLRPGGVADVKETLSARVSDLYGGEVLAVYFTQLVVA